MFSGVKCREGVVIAADKRATMGKLISTGAMVKIFELTPRIWAAGAGTAADCVKVAAHMQGEMKLFELQLGRATRVQTIVGRVTSKLFEHQGHLGCHYILGGIDSTGRHYLFLISFSGTHLARISADGSTHFGSYHCMGSGGLHALTVMSAGYTDDMSIEDAKELASRSIVAGIQNDLFSGTSVDMIVILPNSTEFITGPIYHGSNLCEKSFDC